MIEILPSLSKFSIFIANELGQILRDILQDVGEIEILHVQFCSPSLSVSSTKYVQFVVYHSNPSIGNLRKNQSSDNFLKANNSDLLSSSPSQIALQSASLKYGVLEFAVMYLPTLFAEKCENTSLRILARNSIQSTLYGCDDLKRCPTTRVGSQITRDLNSQVLRQNSVSSAPQPFIP